MMPTLTIAALQKLNRPTVLGWGFLFVLCYRLLATACGHGEPTAERRSRSRTGLADAQCSHDGERIRAGEAGVKRSAQPAGTPTVSSASGDTGTRRLVPAAALSSIRSEATIPS